MTVTGGGASRWRGWWVGTHRLSWGAVFAGAAAALAVWATLTAFGLAVGLTAIDPQDPGSLRTSGIFTGVWGMLTPLLALFVGGLVGGRGSPETTRSAGVLHGVVVWSVTMLAGFWLLGSFISAVAGGALQVTRTAAEAGGAAIGGAVRGGQAGQLAEAFGLDAQDALAPINQRLTAAGMPTVSADELQKAVGGVINEALRTGRLDRQLLVQQIADKTSLSRSDAQEVAMRIEMQLSAFGERAQAMMEQARTRALSAAEQTGKAFWGVFIALLLGLGAAVGGAALTVGRGVPPVAAPPEPEEA